MLDNIEKYSIKVININNNRVEVKIKHNDTGKEDTLINIYGI